MAKLPKFTLAFSQAKDEWVLFANKTHRTVETFDTKAEATTGGALKEALGDQGGSVRIEKVKGGFQEERTFPRSADPKKSPG